MLFLVILLLMNCVYSKDIYFGLIDPEGLLSLTRPEDFVFQTKCIKGVDCFYNGPPWYNFPERPFSPVPSDVKVIIFNLYTPQNPEESYILKVTKKSVRNSPFNSTFSTEVIIHGLIIDGSRSDGYKQGWDLKDSLLSVGDYNVIVVDYSKYAQKPYFQAVANIRVAAARIAILLKKIMNVTGVNASSFHLTGFSLGAQVCGYIGKRIPHIGRITALSGAGPYFEGTADKTHLIPSDATFVDAIHTNGGYGIYGIAFGSLQQLGDQDFYVNGGVRQPGCLPEFIPPLLQPQKLANYAKQFILTLCDHVRALELYIESVVNSTNCTFRAVECDSYEDFQARKCKNSTVAVMGFTAKSNPDVDHQAKFYLRTSDTEPYCIDDSTIPKPKNESLLQKLLKILF